MTSGQKFKRRQFWIEPKLQLKFIALSAAFMLVFALVVGGGVYFGVWRSITQEFSAAKVDKNLQQMKRMQEYQMARTRQQIDSMPVIGEWAKMLSSHDKDVLNGILVRSNRNLLPLALFTALVIIVLSVLLSHRVAGPVFRMKRELKKVAGGDMTADFSLRRKDELKDLASGLEFVVKNFAADVSRISECVEKAEKSCQTADCRKYLNEAKSMMSKYKIKS